MAFSAVFCRRSWKEESWGFLGGCAEGGQWKGDVVASGSASAMLHEPSVSLFPTHRHPEAGYQLLGQDLGFQIPNHIFPLDTHNLIHHMRLELQLHR